MNAPDTIADFTGRTVMIIGAAGYLGQAVAAAFRRRGARLFLIDRTYGPNPDTGSGDVNAIADLLDTDAVAAATTAALHVTGRIDVLCNLAGGFAMGTPVHETSAADWDAMFDTNLRGTLNAVRAVVPSMLRAGGGRIVNVAAFSALRGVALMGPYCASKDAVIRLTETMAAELRDNDINVNCVLPSILDTPANRAAMPAADTTRWVGVDALADVVVFLASDGARAVHGAAVPVIGRV